MSLLFAQHMQGVRWKDRCGVWEKSGTKRKMGRELRTEKEKERRKEEKRVSAEKGESLGEQDRKKKAVER